MVVVAAAAAAAVVVVVHRHFQFPLVHAILQPKGVVAAEEEVAVAALLATAVCGPFPASSLSGATQTTYKAANGNQQLYTLNPSTRLPKTSWEHHQVQVQPE
jgi:hypothetical protein